MQRSYHASPLSSAPSVLTAFALPFLLHLLSLLISLFLPCLPLPSLNPPYSPLLSPSVVLCQIYSASFEALIISLMLRSALKGRNRRRARGVGQYSGPETPRPPPCSLPPSIHLLFCLPLPSLCPQFVLQFQPRLFLSSPCFVFSFPGSSIMRCRRRLRRCRVIISYLFKFLSYTGVHIIG